MAQVPPPPHVANDAEGGDQPTVPPPPQPMFAPTNVEYKFATHLFGDPTKDPHHGRYQPLLAPFLIDPNVGANNLTPAAIRDLIAQAGSNYQPIALGLLHNGKMRIYLCPQRMDPGLGEVLPPHVTGNMYAFDGDLNYNSGFNVVLPDTLFHMTNNNVLAPTAQEILTTLAADPNAEMLGPFNQNDQNVITCRTRRVIAIPFSYVGLFLATTITPRVYFDTIYPVIQNDGNEVACEALTRYFQVAITHTAPGQPSSADIPLGELPTGVNELVVQQRRRTLLEHYFPLIGTNMANLQNNQIATAIADLDKNLQDSKAEEEARRAARDNDDDMASFLGEEVMARVMCMCNVATDRDLPEVWHMLKKNNRRQWVSMVSAAYHREKEVMEQNFLTMGATLSEINVMKTAIWHMPTPDSIKSGFQLFTCGGTDEERHMEYVSEVSLLLSGGASASLNDIRDITKLDVTLPTEIGIINQLLRYECKARVWLGRESVFTRWITELNRSLRIGRPLWEAWTPPRSASVTKAGKGILLAKWVANRASAFFQAQAISPAPLTTRLPEPNYIVDWLSAEEQWAPDLSPAFMAVYRIREFCNMLTTPSEPDGTSSSRGALPNASPLPGPVIGPTDRPRASNSRLNNLHYKEHFFGTFKNRDIPNRLVKQLISSGELPPLPPSKVPGAPTCLSFHSKGYCNTGCGASADHVEYLEPELTPLHQWCHQNYPASTPSPAPASSAAEGPQA